jgi:hypothetical protein
MQMKKRYRLAMVDDNVKILLIPIFSGDITCGHFSLAVVDRLTSTLSYFGSFAGLDQGIGAKTLERLVEKGFADKDMARRIHVAGGGSGMINQGLNTNDCGVFASCFASAYVKAVILGCVHTGKVELSRRAAGGIIMVGFTTLEKNATTWGKYGRHHIGEAIRTSKINMDDDAVSWIMMSMAPDP